MGPFGGQNCILSMATTNTNDYKLIKLFVIKGISLRISYYFNIKYLLVIMFMQYGIVKPKFEFHISFQDKFYNKVFLSI